MEKIIAVGHELNITVSFSGLVANVGAIYKGEDGVEVSLNAKIPAQAYLNKLKALIPGQVDDMIIDVAANLAAKL